MVTADVNIKIFEAASDSAGPIERRFRVDFIDSIHDPLVFGVFFRLQVQAGPGNIQKFGLPGQRNIWMFPLNQIFPFMMTQCAAFFSSIRSRVPLSDDLVQPVNQFLPIIRRSFAFKCHVRIPNQLLFPYAYLNRMHFVVAGYLIQGFQTFDRFQRNLRLLLRSEYFFHISSVYTIRSQTDSAVYFSQTIIGMLVPDTSD